MVDFLPEETKNELRYIDAHEMPSSDQQLWEHIAAYLGFHVPRVAICKNHVAPFDFIASVFFERECNVIAFANRSGGKTTDVAILNHMNSIHKNLYETVAIGAIRDQSDKCYQYTTSLSEPDNPWFGQDRIFSIKRETKYRNGSTVQVLTGSLAGCNSSHPLCVIADEVELMGWDVLQEAYCMAQSKRGYQAIQVLLSTRKFASGNMHKLLVQKPKEPSWKFRVFPWCVFEVAKKCIFPNCEQCKKEIRINKGKPESWYDICHDIDKDGIEHYPDGKCRLSDGYYEIEDIWTKFTVLDWDVFDAQYLCKKPGRKGLVFGSFDRLIHCENSLVNEWRQRLHHDRWEQDPETRSLEIAVLMDPGWAAPLAVLWVAKDKRDNLFYFDSIYRAELADRDLVPMILERFKKYNMPSDFPIRCDERAAKQIAELCNLGLKVSAIWLSPDERMRLLRKWLDGNYREGYPGICIDPDTCEPFCVELETLKLKLDKEGNPRDEMPDKGADHLIDCAGYGFSALGLTGGLKIELIRAKPESPPSRLSVPTRSDWMRR